MARLEDLLKSKPKGMRKRKLGNRKKVWRKQALKNSTIEIGD